MPTRGRNTESAVAREWRASVAETRGHRSSASRSRRWVRLLDGEIHQQGEMLPGAKPDRLTGGGKEGGLTQATEIPLRLHRESHW